MGEGGECRRHETGEGEKMPKYRVSKTKRQQALDLRRDSTDAEFFLWQLLRSRQLDGFKFHKQVPVGPWIVDFIAFEQKIIVEADGGQHSDSIKDRTRDADLRERGFRVLRFWNNEIFANKDGVLHRILELARNPPHPAPHYVRRDPLPQRERVKQQRRVRPGA
jgi:very-short-patch-repair endonuclease